MDGGINQSMEAGQLNSIDPNSFTKVPEFGRSATLTFGSPARSKLIRLRSAEFPPLPIAFSLFFFINGNVCNYIFMDFGVIPVPINLFHYMNICIHIF